MKKKIMSALAVMLVMSSVAFASEAPRKSEPQVAATQAETKTEEKKEMLNPLGFGDEMKKPPTVNMEVAMKQMMASNRNAMNNAFWQDIAMSVATGSVQGVPFKYTLERVGSMVLQRLASRNNVTGMMCSSTKKTLEIEKPEVEVAEKSEEPQSILDVVLAR